MKKIRIAITDCDHKNVDVETKIFNEAGFEFEFMQCKSEEEIVSRCKGYEVLLNQYAPMTERVIAQLSPYLRQIVRYGVGVNNIDVAAATTYGVLVCNVPDYGVNEVADHALALMLALVRKIVIMNEHTKTQKWDYTYAIPILRHSAMKVGIVGLGRIGRAFAKRVHVLGCKVLCYDPLYTVNKADGTDYVQQTTFEKLLREADLISIHCPAENATNLFDKRAFSQMKNTAYIVNTSRGDIIDEQALDDALSSGAIKGAALDVFHKEPMSAYHQLFRHKNVICTPHMAWYSEQSALELKQKVAQEAVRFILGEACHYPVNHVSGS